MPQMTKNSNCSSHSFFASLAKLRFSRTYTETEWVSNEYDNIWRMSNVYVVQIVCRKLLTSAWAPRNSQNQQNLWCVKFFSFLSEFDIRANRDGVCGGSMLTQCDAYERIIGAVLKLRDALWRESCCKTKSHPKKYLRRKKSTLDLPDLKP